MRIGCGQKPGTRPAGGLPEITGDRGLLAQVLDNLVSNAVKFTPADGTVWVRAASEGDGVALSVQDTGPGIPPDEVPKVFDRFFRASTAGEAPGTGLGLAIVKAIVEAHGGSIEVTSEVGVGTTFRCVLPPTGPVSHDEPTTRDRVEA